VGHQVEGFGEININNCNMFFGLHRDTPIIKTLKQIGASGAMFNETVLSRMQNIGFAAQCYGRRAVFVCSSLGHDRVLYRNK